MIGKELVDKYCMSCSLGLCNCTIPVGKCPYIKVREAVQGCYDAAMVAYEKVYQDGTEVAVAQMDGYVDGVKAVMMVLEGL